MDEHSSHSHGSGNPLAQLEHLLDEYLGRKAPQIPEKWRAWLVTAIPWLTLIVFLFTLPAIIFLLGISTVLIPVGIMMGPAGFGTWHVVSLILVIASLLLEIFALPGLFKKHIGGWRLAFYASLVSFVQNILFFSVGGIIGGIIGLWILFQVKSHYK